MSQYDPGQAAYVGPEIANRRFVSRFGPVAVAVAVLLALASFLIFANLTPIPPSDLVILVLFIANLVVILVLIGLVIAEGLHLLRAYRAQAAGARLHVRIVSLFSVVAAVPAILMAIVGSVTLERSLNPAFMQDMRGFVLNTVEAARLFRETQCKSLLQEARLTAADLDRGKTMFEADRALYKDYFGSRAKFLGFTAAAMLKSNGEIVEKIDTGANTSNQVVKPEPADFEDAKKNEPLCLVLDEGRTFVALRELTAFPDTYLYAARPVDPFAIQFSQESQNLLTIYDVFDAHRRNIQIAFATMYALIATIMLLSATWLGLSFANRLVTPIRRLIAATDQVSTGNLYVQVPIRRSEGDLAHLGETFNKMTSELRLQQNSLIAASKLIDERRLFTEAVLSGVPAGVFGVSASGLITVLNPSAERILGISSNQAIGRSISEIIPEIDPVIDEAKREQKRLVQQQITMVRNGRERIYNTRITSEPTERTDRGYVVTLDDMTDLVSAQRTAAWADVARRIAHEIKNPLTPIQLSAERLKRKYSKTITQDRDIFDQCTDTIVRQVDDIKRMVDEFSSFARMPKSRPEQDDLSDCVRQALFLMRVGNPDITFEDELPDATVMAHFDRRLLSQALTNVIKNATEGIAADDRPDKPAPRIRVTLSVVDDVASIDVVDNGKGFPTDNRQRLLEPYMTTRAEGTGLGLPIVAKILEDHGGGIELLDAPEGQGARVRLHFPLNPGVAPHIDTEKA